MSTSVTDEKKEDYGVIGKNPLRHDGTDKVTGRAQYGADIHLPGMLYGAMLRSPHAHARILSVDTSKAETFPGVKAVVTAEDLPDVESKVAELGPEILERIYPFLGLSVGKAAQTVDSSASERIRDGFQSLPDMNRTLRTNCRPNHIRSVSAV